MSLLFKELMKNRWDSSDPERAPPPLPLNPQSPGVSRAGTSSAIQSAHAALQEKARESANLIPHIPKRAAGDPSPERTERPPLRNTATAASHRRLNSLQNSTVKDISLMLESGYVSNTSASRSPEKHEFKHDLKHDFKFDSKLDTKFDKYEKHENNKHDKYESKYESIYERPSTPTRSRENHVEFKDEKEDTLKPAPTMGSPRTGPSLTPGSILRQANSTSNMRRPHQSILGENTPPQSATMLALQNMSSASNLGTSSSVRDSDPLANITNGSSGVTKTTVTPLGLEALSNQLITLTNIASALQREMSALSRRSRDNATDLLSLKEATNQRDEDIRRSLRELITEAKSRAAQREAYGGGPPSPTSLKSRPFSLPRIPSPHSFGPSLDRESLLSTPSLVADTSSIALLEKILRDMGTKEGQESLLSRLNELARQLSGFSTSEKLEEIIRLVKANQQHALVPATGGAGRGGGGGGGGGGRNKAWSFSEDEDGRNSRVGRFLEESGNSPTQTQSSRATDSMNDEILSALRIVKDHLAQGGSLTSDVKSLVKELRGEVLDMGQEIGRRLNEVSSKSPQTLPVDNSTKEAMNKIVSDGLEEMRQNMVNIVHEHRKKAQETVAAAPRIDSMIDYREIYNSMRAALKDSQANKPRVQELRREDVVQAVQDAFEKYKPEIEIQQIGLERHEVLDCLKEGLGMYLPKETASKQDVFAAINEGFSKFETVSRDDVLESVRECLDEFDFPVTPQLSKDDIMSAVKDGLSDLPKPLKRQEVVNAMDESLNKFDFTVDMAEAVQDGVRSLDLPKDMQTAVTKALETFDFSSAGPSSEDMIDAVQEAIETMDLPCDVTRAVVKALQTPEFAQHIASYLPRPDLSRVDLADAVREGFDALDISGDVARAVKESLKELDLSDLSGSHSKALVRHGTTPPSILKPETEEIIERLYEIRDSLRDEFRAFSEKSKPTSRGGDAERTTPGITMDDFEKLRHDIEAYVDRARTDGNSDDLIPHMTETLERFREEVAELVKKASRSTNDLLREELESLRDVVNGTLVPVTPLAQPGSNAEILEAIGAIRKEMNTTSQHTGEAAETKILQALQEGLGDLKKSIDKLSNKAGDLSANDEILDALKEGLKGVRADLEELRAGGGFDDEFALTPFSKDGDQPSKQLGHGSVEEIRSLHAMVDKLGKKVEAMERGAGPSKAAAGARTATSKSELGDVEALLRKLIDSVASLAAREQKQQKINLSPLEETIRSLQTSVDTAIGGLRKSIDEWTKARSSSAAPKQPEPELLPTSDPTDPATKEDVQAIETILRNTKDSLDDFVSAQGLQRELVRKEHVDALEVLLVETKSNLGDLSKQVEGVSRKEDVSALESLIAKMTIAFDEMRTRDEKEDSNKLTKADLEAVETVCLEVKSLVSSRPATTDATTDSPTATASRPDMDSNFKTLTEKLEAQAEATTKANGDITDRVSEVKSLLEEFHEVIKAKLTDGAKGVDSIHKVLAPMSEIVKKNATLQDELMELWGGMKEGFEEGRTTINKAKTDIETKIEELQKAQIYEIKETVATKGQMEELKTALEPLSGTVTEAVEKMEVSSKTVFERVDELVCKADENHLDIKAEHALTREQVQEMTGKLDGLQSLVAEHQPKVAENLQEVLALVGQHFEHSKTTTEGLQTKVINAMPTVNEKLEKLVGHTGEAEKAFAHLEDVHKQVKNTSAELAEFIAAQTQRAVEEDENKKKILQETTIALERQLAEKEAIEARLAELKEEEARVKESINVTLREEQDQLKSQFLENLQHEQARLKQMNESLKQEQEELKSTFLANLAEEEHRLKTLNESLRKEHEEAKAVFMAGLKEEETRLKELNASLKEEHETLKKTFTINLEEERDRLMEINVALKEEQDTMKKTFAANLRDERDRLIELNSALKAEHESLKRSFLAVLKDEEARLKESNDALREEQQALKDKFLKNLREEESLLKEVNEGLRQEQKELRSSFLAAFKEEERRLKEINASLREEQEEMKAIFREEQEKLKVDLLANLMEEECRLKERNEALRKEHDKLKEQFLADLRAEQQGIKHNLVELRGEQEELVRKKSRLTADLSSLDTALRLRREELHEMETRAETLERRILEGVMDHSRLLLMAKGKRFTTGVGRESMNRKRVPSQMSTRAPSVVSRMESRQPTSALNMAAINAKTRTPKMGTGAGSSASNRRILSLSQMVSGALPGGSIKRSNSVRNGAGGGGVAAVKAAVAAHHGDDGTSGTSTPKAKERKGSWATTSSKSTAKGYGGLSKQHRDFSLKDTDDEDEEGYDTATPPVDVRSGSDEDMVHVDDDARTESSSRYGGDEDHNETETETEADETATLRRSSHGTTVITSSSRSGPRSARSGRSNGSRDDDGESQYSQDHDQDEGDDNYSDYETGDDSEDDWTERGSAISGMTGTTGTSRTGRSSVSAPSIAPSASVMSVASSKMSKASKMSKDSAISGIPRASPKKGKKAGK
uniref:Related to transport protein USO1 n=1 Tax=Neurospora crassa TaxID=5141 RepID=Q873K7_NEUCS|nr:related to transport protein USO1 [Neurospora crassa]